MMTWFRTIMSKAFQLCKSQPWLTKIVSGMETVISATFWLARCLYRLCLAGHQRCSSPSKLSAVRWLSKRTLCLLRKFTHSTLTLKIRDSSRTCHASDNWRSNLICPAEADKSKKNPPSISLWTHTAMSRYKRSYRSSVTISSHPRTFGLKSNPVLCLWCRVEWVMEHSCRNSNSSQCEARAPTITKTFTLRRLNSSISNRLRCNSSNKHSFSNKSKVVHQIAHASQAPYPPRVHLPHLNRLLTLLPQVLLSARVPPNSYKVQVVLDPSWFKLNLLRLQPQDCLHSLQVGW